MNPLLICEQHLSACLGTNWHGMSLIHMEERNLFLPVTTRQEIRRGIQVIEEREKRRYGRSRGKTGMPVARTPNDGTIIRIHHSSRSSEGQGDEDERCAWTGVFASKETRCRRKEYSYNRVSLPREIIVSALYQQKNDFVGILKTRIIPRILTTERKTELNPCQIQHDAKVN